MYYISWMLEKDNQFLRNGKPLRPLYDFWRLSMMLPCEFQARLMQLQNCLLKRLLHYIAIWIKFLKVLILSWQLHWIARCKYHKYWRDFEKVNKILFIINMLIRVASWKFLRLFVDSLGPEWVSKLVARLRGIIEQL